MQITTFFILAFASPKEVKEEVTPTETERVSPVRRYSSIYDAFTRGIKASMGLHARIYIGLTLEGESDRDCFFCLLVLMARSRD